MTPQFKDNTFVKTTSALLRESNTSEILNMFRKQKNRDEIYNNAWDLIPIVAHYLTEDVEVNNTKVFKCCKEVINILAECSQAEEVLLQFIEEIEVAKGDVKFLTLLHPLKMVLLRVPEKRLTSLGWSFNAIRHYLGKIEVPEDLNLMDEERLLLDADDTVNRIINLYDSLLTFCNTFVKELINIDKNNSSLERKWLIGKFLLELIGKPLASLNLDVYKKTKPRIRIIAEKLVESYFSLVLDPFVYIEMHDNDFGSDLVKPNNLSLGVFFYLILSEEVFVEHLPKVYNSIYVFQNSLKFVNELLAHSSQFLLEKGVYLSQSLLRAIDEMELSYLLLDSPQHSMFCETISKIIVHNENESVRRKSLQIFQKYLWSFEHQGRYLIIMNLMLSLDHSSLKGNIIMQYKEMLTKEISSGGLQKINKYYKKHKLFDMLDVFTVLQNKEESDLVNVSDQIVATLNFLRYLIIIDKSNESGIDGYLNTLEEGYFKHLKMGIAMSKEHYHLKIKEVTETNNTESVSSVCQVSVSNKHLMEMPAKTKIDVMKISLTTLDVVDSLLNRLMECIHFKTNELK